MKNNDISNVRAPIVGVRCENCLFKLKDKNLIDKALNSAIGCIKRADINEDVLKMIKQIYWNTEMTVELIIDKENFSPKVEDYLKELPCSQIGVVLKSISEVTMMLNTGELTYFVTDDSIEKSNVNSKYAFTHEEFNSILRKQVR